MRVLVSKETVLPWYQNDRPDPNFHRKEREEVKSKQTEKKIGEYFSSMARINVFSSCVLCSRYRIRDILMQIVVLSFPQQQLQL